MTAAFKGCAAALLALLACAGASRHARADEARHVLMLHAYNFTFPGTAQTADAARKRLMERAPFKVEIDADYLNLVRSQDAEHEARTARFLRDKYARSRPDVIMTFGRAALPFIVKHRDTIAPGVPVILTNISRRSYQDATGVPGVTAILTEFDLEATLALARRLQPKARRVIFVAGGAPADRHWHETVRALIANQPPDLEATALLGVHYEDLLGELGRVPADSIVILLTVFGDDTARSYIPRDVAAELSRVSAAPVYGPYETFLGQGVVGGYVETFESVGRAAADMALDILGSAGSVVPPARENPNRSYFVDHRAMQRWRLGEQGLPTGTQILFRPPSIWDQHRDFVVGTILVVVLQAGFVGALLIQRRRQRQTEALLKESEERMTYVAASTNVSLWQGSIATGELWATEHCRALFGLSPEAPLTREILLEAMHPEDRDTAISALRKAVRGESSVVFDVRVRPIDDKARWVRIHAHTQFSPGGSPSKLNGLFVDISDQKEAEAEAAQRRQELAHLMRVSLLGELSGSIAHEVNQPLTAILSNAQGALNLLALDSPDLDEVRDALKDIVQEDKRAGEVIQRLRGLMKKGERRIEWVDLNELIASTLKLLHGELVSRRIGVHAELASSTIGVRGDPVQLQQVLLNLIMNGMDAMASTPATRRQITISTRSDVRGSVEVRVRDRGPGIDPGQAGRLAEPFFTTKAHGLGLGLTICSTILRAHGARLSVVNDPEGGAVAGFTISPPEALRAAE